MNQLIASRALQGIGGGILITMSLRSVPDLFPPRQRGRVQGLIALVFGMASVIGPSLGGFITDQLSWNWIFLINLPVGIPVLLLIIRTFPNIRPEAGDRKLDYPGMMALALSVVTLMLALSWAGVQYDWASPQVMGPSGIRVGHGRGIPGRGIQVRFPHHAPGKYIETGWFPSRRSSRS